MKTIHFYVDFISPYAWLGFDALPRALEGISHHVVHKPVLFAAMLKHHGQLGPAEIPAKRDWTYRQVLWLARQQGTPLQLPAMHPFNPLGLLRLATACDADGEPGRYVCEKIFRHVWPQRKTPAAPKSSRPCKSTHKRRLSWGCLACPVGWSMAACFGGKMHCPCCAHICKAMPGLMALTGRPLPGVRWGAGVHEAFVSRAISKQRHLVKSQR